MNTGGISDWLRQRSPFGILADGKPHHFLEIFRTLGENAGDWHRVWQVLNGPCNGCAVQTDGLKDNVLPNAPHFCLVRLGLIEEALRDAAPDDAFANGEAVARLGNDLIERLGRLTKPLLWRRDQPGYRPIPWSEAYDLAADWLRECRGDASGFFATSKAVCNEEYYAFQQFARVVGQTNNIDSCARQCHAASVTALKSQLGAGVSTGSLSDFVNADVLVLAGTNLANNQPLTVRYIEHGKRTRGGKPYVIVVNPFREPGLERYWVPSNPKSALVGTQIADEFVQVRVGGDVAFFNGVLKIIIEDGLLTDRHRRFINDRTTGFDAIADGLAEQSITDLERLSGVDGGAMRRVAMLLARSENAMFVWGMGLTQHATGTDNVKSVVNLALALGQFGRPACGVAPLRGQSGVQATGECGVAPNVFPGGATVNAESAVRFSEAWITSVPSNPGLATGHMLEAVDRGDIRLLFALGGNLRETMPDRGRLDRILAKLPYRIRLDVMMNRETMIPPGEASLVLPIRNWYEWDSVFTTTATDRTIRAFTGTVRPKWVELPESWQALRQLADRILGPDAAGFSYEYTQELRDMMDQTIAIYRGIAQLRKPHDQMQWGGTHLFTNGFPNMPDNRAAFQLVTPREKKVRPGQLLLTTRRGFGQWNSQHRPSVKKDSFTSVGARDTVLLHPDDLASRNLADGARVNITSDTGTLRATCQADHRVLPGHLHAFWPLANDLIPAGVYDEPSVEPDYNVSVTITPIEPASERRPKSFATSPPRR
jgi:molybdopterin-dependent oxidoreductase alpha subunit